MIYARDQLKKIYSVDIADVKDFPANNTSNHDYSEEIVENVEFREKIEKLNLEFSVEFEDRFFRSHSQAPRDFFILKFEYIKRIPDMVIWPKSHNEVENIVKLANELNVVIIPVGGCTNVTMANNCPDDEKRMIVSLDMTQMNRLLWLDDNSLLACFESGITGGDLERTLQSRGFIMGHEPDSIEFSTLGGWIATRSSGIKQQAYGNIEDIVVSSRTVTSIGVLEKNFTAPRAAMGPEFEHMVLGSEGTFGVVTEAIVKIHRTPKVRRYGSIIFPDFFSGIRCFHECSQTQTLPSSLRLLDNDHFQNGLALRYNSSIFTDLVDLVKKQVLTTILRYDENTLAMATFLIEGEKKTVDAQEANLEKIAKKYQAIMTGEKYGQRGYVSTFVVGYVRVNYIQRFDKLRLFH